MPHSLRDPFNQLPRAAATQFSRLLKGGGELIRCEYTVDGFSGCFVPVNHIRLHSVHYALDSIPTTPPHVGVKPATAAQKTVTLPSLMCLIIIIIIINVKINVVLSENASRTRYTIKIKLNLRK